MKTTLWIPDCHVPYEDKKALRLVLKVMRAIRPSTVVVLGDAIDCLEVSSFLIEDPDPHASLLTEIAEWEKYLDKIDEIVPRARRVWCEGNHEKRIRRYTAGNARAIHGTFTLPDRLNLRKRGWEWHKYHDIVKIGKIHVSHDFEFSGINAHRQSQVKVGGSVVMGHTHRLSVEYSGNLKGGRHVAAMMGWLGDKKYADYMSPASREHWQLGFGIGYHEPNGVVHLQPVPIINYRCVVNGRLYSA